MTMSTTAVRIARRGPSKQYLGPVVREERKAIWIDGGLAVTRTLGGPGYSITHVASGYALITGIATQRNAIKAAKRFVESGIDWTVSRTAITGATKNTAKAVRDQLRAEGILT